MQSRINNSLFMVTFVLVHGGNMSADTWNRLVGRQDYPPGSHLGAKYWDGTLAWLTAHGHTAVAPELADEYTHNLSDHIGQVSSLVEQMGSGDIVLVGHSYGGMVITGVADWMPDRVIRLVYVDAALPDPGQSLFDLFAASGLDPLSFAGLEAASAYVEKIRFSPRTIQAIKKTYIRCTESEFQAVTAAAKRKIAAHNAGWTYLELPTSHVPMATMPGRFFRLLDHTGRS